MIVCLFFVLQSFAYFTTPSATSSTFNTGPSPPLAPSTRILMTPFTPSNAHHHRGTTFGCLLAAWAKKNSHPLGGAKIHWQMGKPTWKITVQNHCAKSVFNSKHCKWLAAHHCCHPFSACLFIGPTQSQKFPLNRSATEGYQQLQGPVVDSKQQLISNGGGRQQTMANHSPTHRMQNDPLSGHNGGSMLPNNNNNNQQQESNNNTNASNNSNSSKQHLLPNGMGAFHLNGGSKMGKQQCEIHHSILQQHHLHHRPGSTHATLESAASHGSQGHKEKVNFCRAWLNKFPSRSKRIDVISRIFFPKMFALFNLVYWTTYLFREDDIVRS